uniref:Ribosomal protein S20 n=1 Tax=Schimmelmannia schousboei TaxID=173468 RepID=A0A1C9C8K3_9FLOR|nr:ribosomal protein S20 [Schimmelmannia schousboei]AOM64717.1 ribosomal protein S20 [Schimmelmannia schousboei]
MSKNLSAVKKTKIASRNRCRNKIYKSSIKTWSKKYLVSLQNNQDFNQSHIIYNLNIAYKKIDKAVKKGILHKNNGARKKAMLARVLKNMNL